MTPRIFAAVVVVLLILLFLCTSHARATDGQDACFDELLARWNEFATDANRHVHLVEAQPADREKTHRRLEREWRTLQNLSCW